METVGNDFVTLNWTKPEENGGAEVTSYTVEQRMVGTTKWAKSNSGKPVETATVTVTNLIESQEYTFRVSATNEAGTGKPSEESAPIKIKAPSSNKTDSTFHFITIA